VGRGEGRFTGANEGSLGSGVGRRVDCGHCDTEDVGKGEKGGKGGGGGFKPIANGFNYPLCTQLAPNVMYEYLQILTPRN
jgi:hypothetical protein